MTERRPTTEGVQAAARRIADCVIQTPLLPLAWEGRHLWVKAERGAVLVPSFDDVDVIEGQGTIGVEIRARLGRAPPLLAVPCGGGGLSAGIALALPETRVIVVEPEGWDDMARSLAAGAIVPV